jgi:hypothetical protein
MSSSTSFIGNTRTDSPAAFSTTPRWMMNVLSASARPAGSRPNSSCDRDDVARVELEAGQLRVDREQELGRRSGEGPDPLALQVLRGLDVRALGRHDRRQRALVNRGQHGEAAGLDVTLAHLVEQTDQVDVGEVGLASEQGRKVLRARAELDVDLDPGLFEVALLVSHEDKSVVRGGAEPGEICHPVRLSVIAGRLGVRLLRTGRGEHG